MSAVMRNTILACLVVCASGAARADQYWVAYEGNDFPENEGWERRIFGDGPANQQIIDGTFVLDSMWSDWVADNYWINRQLNPGNEEVFVASWRLRVLDNRGPAGIADTGLTIARDGMGTLSFRFDTTQIVSTREGWSYSFEPGVFHDFELRSIDMINYSLLIDGVQVHAGAWDLNSLNESYFVFGDAVLGSASVSQWDYVRFGVIPEPSNCSLLLVGAALVLAKRRSR